MLDPEAQSAIDALLAEIPPLKNPLPLSAKPITDAELDGAVVVGVLKDPGRTKTQVAGSLPQGASQRRLAAVDRMAKAGRIVPRRGPAPPNAGGKVLAHDYYWPPGDIELTTNLTTTATDDGVPDRCIQTPHLADQDKQRATDWARGCQRYWQSGGSRVRVPSPPPKVLVTGVCGCGDSLWAGANVANCSHTAGTGVRKESCSLFSSRTST